MIEHVPLELADSLFKGEMHHFIKRYFKPELGLSTIEKEYYSLFREYFQSKGMNGIAMGKTGHLYDLYLWKEEHEVTYNIDLPEGQDIEVPVVFMSDFVSNGWSHYTTFGHSYSGGWATRDKLFCVEEAYGDKAEEAFLVSYIAHEGQHFGDYLRFPKLKQADLEFRAKLTELALAKEIAYTTISKFIHNAKNDKAYAHAYANHMVIRWLSEELFKTPFEQRVEQWKKVPVEQINKAALKLLKAHSIKLKHLGPEIVEAYITTL